MPEPQILAMGGLPDDTLLDHALGLARGNRFRERGTMGHLTFFPWPPPNLRELVLGQDVILVSGGNTANAIAIWRAQGFDEILREAWQQGILLTGWSAGMICWFAHG